MPVMLDRYLDILLFSPRGSSILPIERFSYFNEISSRLDLDVVLHLYTRCRCTKIAKKDKYTE